MVTVTARNALLLRIQSVRVQSNAVRQSHQRFLTTRTTVAASASGGATPSPSPTPLRQLVGDLKSGTLSASALMQTTLDRIEDMKRLNAFVCVEEAELLMRNRCSAERLRLTTTLHLRGLVLPSH